MAPLLFMVLLANDLLSCSPDGLIPGRFSIDAEVLVARPFCGYLLDRASSGPAFYAVVVKADPGGPSASPSIETRVNLGDMLYFSYTTLTTDRVSGDILPKNIPWCGCSAVLEAVVGHLSTNTIVIARFCRVIWPETAKVRALPTTEHPDTF